MESCKVPKSEKLIVELPDMCESGVLQSNVLHYMLS